MEKAILIVDDEIGICENLKSYLELDGFTNIVTASNAFEAIQILKSQEISMIITDIRMPNGSGLELLETIKQTLDELPPLVFISAFADVNKEDAQRMGALDVFEKPIDLENLSSLVKKTIAS